MRMWMTDPKIMCKNHLLGEHRELHALIGIFKRKKSIKGHIDGDQVEPLSIEKRHNELVTEMLRRNYKHNSPLKLDISILDYLSKDDREHTINRKYSKIILLARCKHCQQREENRNEKTN